MPLLALNKYKQEYSDNQSLLDATHKDAPPHKDPLLQRHEQAMVHQLHLLLHRYYQYLFFHFDLQQYDFVRGGLDRLTKRYIQEELFYRFVVIQNDESIQLVRKIENELKTGFKGYGKPLLNGI